MPTCEEVQKMADITKTAIIALNDTLSKDQKWITSKPTPKQAFALELLVLFCSKVTITNHSLSWMDKFSLSLPLLGAVYQSCDKEYKVAITKGCVPDQTRHNPCSFVEQYFAWVLTLYQLLQHWKSQYASSYEMLKCYSVHHGSAKILADAITAQELLVPKKVIADEYHKYLCAFESLNKALIHYIPNDQDAVW